MDRPPGARAASRLPLWLKWVYTAFVAVLVPCYWHAYGPTNFLFFCDIALLITLVGLWRESPLLVSMPAVGILLPQTMWLVDFFGGLIGVHLTGLTDYMFSQSLPLLTRGLSLFHAWLPLLLVWLVWKLGYDARAFRAWTLLAWVVMLIGYFLLPPPPAPADNPNLPVNVNYVFGLGDEPQTWMPPLAYLALLLLVLPALIFWPTHRFLKRCFPAAPQVDYAPAGKSPPG